MTTGQSCHMQCCSYCICTVIVLLNVSILIFNVKIKCCTCVVFYHVVQVMSCLFAAPCYWEMLSHHTTCEDDTVIKTLKSDINKPSHPHWNLHTLSESLQVIPLNHMCYAWHWATLRYQCKLYLSCKSF